MLSPLNGILSIVLLRYYYLIACTLLSKIPNEILLL